MKLFNIRLFRGRVSEVAITLSGGDYSGSEPLSFEICTSDYREILWSGAAQWNRADASDRKVNVSFPAAGTQALRAGSYIGVLSIVDGPVLAIGVVQVIESTAAGGSSLRSLCPVAEAITLFPELRKYDDEFDSLSLILAGATRAIEQYCGRKFLFSKEDKQISLYELPKRLSLRPIWAVERLACCLQPVVSIKCKSADIASVTLYPVSDELTLHSLKLTRIVDGTPSTYVVTLQSYTTVGEVIQVIQAIHSGAWEATGNESFPVIDLAGRGFIETQEAKDIKSVLCGYIHAIDDFALEKMSGVLSLQKSKLPSFLGRITYYGGYAYTNPQLLDGIPPVPEDLKIACVTVAVAAARTIEHGGPVNSQTAAGRSYQLLKDSIIPKDVKAILDSYSDRNAGVL